MKRLILMILVLASHFSCTITGTIIDNHDVLNKCFVYVEEGHKYKAGRGPTGPGKEKTILKGHDYFTNLSGDPQDGVIHIQPGCLVKLTKIISFDTVNGPYVYYELISKNNLCGVDHVYHEEEAACLRNTKIISDEVIRSKHRDDRSCFLMNDVKLKPCPSEK